MSSTDYNNTPKSGVPIPLPNLEIGQKIASNRYIVVKSRGKGGQGHVYEVEQENLGKKHFALKCFYASKEDERQLKEIHVLMDLQHENIIRIYDANVVPIDDEENKSREILYYTMDLGNPIHLEKLSWRESCQIIIKICSGLEYAHSKRVIHTDIKPSNILLREATSSPVLSDFGTAKILSTDSDAVQEKISCKTFAYCAPEQNNIDGKIEPRTDIFSLGKTLFAMLIRSELPSAVYDEPKDFHEFVEKAKIEGVPSQIESRLKKVIVKATQRKVSDRYSTAKEMAEKLENILQPKTPAWVYLLLAFGVILTNVTLLALVYEHWGDWKTTIKIMGHNPDQFLFLFGFYPLAIWFTLLIFWEFWLHSRQRPYLRIGLAILALAIGACPFWAGRIGVGHDFFNLQYAARKEAVWANHTVLERLGRKKNSLDQKEIKSALEELAAQDPHREIKKVSDNYNSLFDKKLDIPNNELLKESLQGKELGNSLAWLANDVIEQKSFSKNQDVSEPLALEVVRAFLFLQFIFDPQLHLKFTDARVLYFSDLINDFAVDCAAGLFIALFIWYLFHQNQISSTTRCKLASLFLLTFSVIVGIWMPAHLYNLKEIDFVYSNYKDHQGIVFAFAFFLFVCFWTFPILKSSKNIFLHTWTVAFGVILLYFIQTDFYKASQIFGSNIQVSILMLLVIILVVIVSFWVSCDQK